MSEPPYPDEYDWEADELARGAGDAVIVGCIMAAVIAAGAFCNWMGWL